MQAVASENATLLQNLHAALEGESNTRARYLDFAEKADGEGWHGVASLLRAAARAEEIHAANHARVLRQSGGEVGCTLHPVDVRSTLENLRVALAGEIFEMETMYPAFLEQARECREVAAIRTFTWAHEAEKAHTRLFNEALTLVEMEDEESWVTMPREFYLCPVCGYTTETPEETGICHTCNCVWSRFEHIR